MVKTRKQLRNRNISAGDLSVSVMLSFDQQTMYHYISMFFSRFTEPRNSKTLVYLCLINLINMFHFTTVSKEVQPLFHTKSNSSVIT